MSYKTNLTQDKRNLLKSQLDDFATFQWRGHDMFEDFGCFIINDKNGSLKFYNGPSFTNQYAKAQFSSASNSLLGVEFKQQTIPMKVGLYWFTIEEYQQFLDCIGPYHVNYITFNFDDQYGYLVKSGKIGDSVKHIIGTDADGNKRYYTELDLTWEVVGDACVRSNLAYEYQATNTSSTNSCQWEIAKYPQDHSDESKQGKIKGDMSDNSLLDTSLVFEVPCITTSNEAVLTLEAILPAKTWSEVDKHGNTQTISMSEVKEELFKVQLQNLTTSASNISGVQCLYSLSPSINSLLEENETIYYCEQGIFDISSAQTFDIIEDLNVGSHLSSGGIRYEVQYESYRLAISFPDHILVRAFFEILSDYINNERSPHYVDWELNTEVNFNTGKIYLPMDWEDLSVSIPVGLIEKASISAFSGLKQKNFSVVYEEEAFTTIAKINSIFPFSEGLGEYPSNVVLLNSGSNQWKEIATEGNAFSTPANIYCKKNEIDSDLWSYLTFLRVGFVNGWVASDPLYQLYLRYDSETGLIYIQKGSQDSWHLLNFQTANNNGASLVSSLRAIKYKIPGYFSLPSRNTTDWTFKLTYSGIDISLLNDVQLNQAITIYSRKNVI